MNILFALQLLTSFFVGGSIIALVGYIAERASRKTAGIILSLPTTVVISFLFIAWATSPNEVGKITPSTIAVNAIVQLYTITYLYISRIKVKTSYSIFLSLSGSLIILFLLSFPFAIFKFDNIILSLIIYGIGFLIGYYFLTYKNEINDIEPPRIYSSTQKILRALFAGCIITLSVFLSKILHPFWGGIFSSFPALFTTTFVTLHYYYGPNMIAKIVKEIPRGSIIYVTFATAAHWTFPAFGAILGMFVAYLSALIPLSILLYFNEKS